MLRTIRQTDKQTDGAEHPTQADRLYLRGFLKTIRYIYVNE